MISNTLIRELQVNPGWTREFIDKLTPYYLATLTHISRGRVTPIFQIVDEFWHAHILCTRDYADFCATQFGRFIHHERTDAVVFDEGADDFFRDYGLSEVDLRSIHAEHAIDRDLVFASCGQGQPPRHPQPYIRAGTTTDQLRVASCGQPSPVPPEWLQVVDRPFKLASCGQPDHPDIEETGRNELWRQSSIG